MATSTITVNLRHYPPTKEGIELYNRAVREFLPLAKRKRDIPIVLFKCMPLLGFRITK